MVSAPACDRRAEYPFHRDNHVRRKPPVRCRLLHLPIGCGAIPARFRIYRHRCNPHLPTRTDNAYGDLATVCNQNLSDHTCIHNRISFSSSVSPTTKVSSALQPVFRPHRQPLHWIPIGPFCLMIFVSA